MNTLNKIGIGLSIVGGILMGIGIIIMFYEPEAAGIFGFPGMVLVLLAAALNVAGLIKKWWKS